MRQDPFYVSALLSQRLEQLLSAPLTLVEAPAGFGKTAAVRHALRALPSEAVHWHTALSDSGEDSFFWLARQLAALDPALDLTLFSSRHVQTAARLSALRSAAPLYLVLDNVPSQEAPWTVSLFHTLAQRPAGGLHIILISRHFSILPGAWKELGSCCSIRREDLGLHSGDIAAFARTFDLELSPARAAELEENTGGWPAAVAAQLCHLPHGGEPEERQTMNRLLKELIWDRLSQREQTILLRLALFDSIDPYTAAQLIPDIPGFSPQNLTQLLDQLPLVSCTPATGRYSAHPMMLSFLLARLNAAPAELRWNSYHAAGCWYREHGQVKEAIAAFYTIHDYDGLLSCPLSGLLMETFAGTSFTDVARSVLFRCPAPVKARYPLSLLRLCYALFAGTAFSEYARLLEEARKIIAATRDKDLMGEWELTAALSAFPDLGKMEAHYLRAKQLLTRPSVLFQRQEPFFFGSVSMWYLFYTKPGKMLATADTMDRVMALYNSMTCGHGSGAAELYRAETYCVQGRFEEAEIQAYQAAYLSRRAQNPSLACGAALVLGIIAIYQADESGLRQVMEELSLLADTAPDTALGRCMTQTARSYLIGLQMEMGEGRGLPRDDFDISGGLTFPNFIVKTAQITDLVLKGEYRRAIGSVEAALKLDPRLLSLPAQTFMHTGLALCYLAIDRPEPAADHLDTVLTLAAQDGNYAFLASFRRYLEPLLDQPALAKKHAAAIRELRAFRIHHTQVESSRIFAQLEGKTISEALTSREQEIALMAARGLRNGEIAAALHISEGTVKNHLKIVFQKLNIDRRSHLSKLLR